MTGLETNIFPITNLTELSSNYRLYRIKGLSPDQNEYYQNSHHIARKLSYLLKNPVTVIERQERPYLVVRNDADEPPSPFPLVRTAVMFERCRDTITLDYTMRSPENDKICLRFIQFMLQEPLRSHPELWQPRSGQPFFKKKPDHVSRNWQHYIGMAVRAVVTPDGGIGLCLDATSKRISRTPLPTYISRDQFKAWKNRSCIYHNGHNWYEIQIIGLDDRNVSEYLLPKDDSWVTLLDYVTQESKKPLPPELTRVPSDAAVVVYLNNQKEDRGVPSPLCYPVYRADNGDGAERHSQTILAHHQRRQKVHQFVRRYQQHLQFGEIGIRISLEPVSAPSRMFTVPDYKFGHSTVLSVSGTPNAHHVSLDNLGRTRLALLLDKKVGFYDTDALDRQYFILPQSVLDSYGNAFLGDLRRTVNHLFPQENGYHPIIVPYHDLCRRTFPVQGRAILEAVESTCNQPGYGVVMIHHTTDRKAGQEDQLAAMVIRELRERGLHVAVIHSAVADECYELVTPTDGQPDYRGRRNKRAKLTGYLRGVALNKVLLTNQRWPFVLATRLHADVTIGIDVKHNTAGLVVVGSNGARIRSICETSRQKEQLLEPQLKTYLIRIISEEAVARTEPIQTIVIHRDGRIWPSELAGAKQAIEQLKEEGMIAPSATLTLIEILKTSPVPLRLFDVTDKDGRPWVENPQVGYFYLTDENDGYLCSTGRAFPRKGTVRPLHVKRAYGLMSLEKCLEDIYDLTTLTWTRPEDCTRYPITIKLNDRFLGEEATEYDTDALEFTDTGAEEEIR
jgi:hypothetical protein